MTAQSLTIDVDLAGGILSPFPPPLWGRVREGGHIGLPGFLNTTPTPNPSPQGGGEKSERDSSLLLTVTVSP